MRILQLHADYIEYEPVEKEIKLAEESEKKKTRLEEIVVLFTAVENGDNEALAKQAIKEIKESLAKIKSNKILIYPYAHLSSNLAKPAQAIKVLKAMENLAIKEKIETYRSPFGWNKKFTIAIKGHPLAEQSKVIVSGREAEQESEALKSEEKLVSHWFILEPNGKMTSAEKFNFKKYSVLEYLKNYETVKSRAVQQMPPHVSLMRRLEIADFEPASDPGNLRYYPKGRLIKSLLEQFVTNEVIKYGGMEVETPIMYDFEHPSLADYLNRFPARQYVIKSEGKEFFLRFSACFGQFLMAHDTKISYKNLPFKIYELTRYSFRREKSGELVGLKRLRTFTMPDVHAMCKDMEQTKKEFVIRFKLCMDVLKAVGFDKDSYEMAIRFTKDFYEENKSFINSLIKMFGKPVLVEIWDKRFFYFVLKYEFNFVDCLNKASALSTDQIDIENAERYGITYVDDDNKRKYPIILHSSPSGGIERVMYAMLEKAHKDQENKKIPEFPLWLSPTQVRLIPLNEKFLKTCKKISDELEECNIRIDIDDRDDTVQKKIRYAELEWVPYIVVIGPKEVKTKKLAVRIRKIGKVKAMPLKKLAEEISKEVEGTPFKRLSLPKLLSKRPIFVG